MKIQRSAKRRGCLLSYSQAEPGRELTQPSPRLLAEPCILTATSYLPWPGIPHGLSPSDDPCLMSDRLSPLAFVVPIDPRPGEKQSAFGGGVALLPQPPRHPRLAVICERVTNAASRDNKLFRNKIGNCISGAMTGWSGIGGGFLQPEAN